MKMQDYAKQIRAEFIRKSAAGITGALACKRENALHRLGAAWQAHPEYTPDRYPQHPRIGCRHSVMGGA